jgi:Mg2+-importing ATPase
MESELSGVTSRFRRSLATWLVALAALAAVVLVASRWAEAGRLAEAAARAKPAWLVVALLLQAATYGAQANLWRLVLGRSGERQSFGGLLRLSLAELFVDQALPSASVSGALFVADSLARRGVRRAAIAMAILTDLMAFYVAYILALGGACVVLARDGLLSATAAHFAIAFVGVCAGLCAALVWLVRRGVPATLPVVGRSHRLRAVLDLLHASDVGAALRPFALVAPVVLQLSVFLLDAATFGVLAASVGASLAPHVFFAAYMFASLARTVSILPGGLGTFEAVATGALALAGVPVPEALVATLLFRALSFWLPMLPGLACARFEVRMRPASRVAVGDAFWQRPTAELMATLGSSGEGLASDIAAARLVESKDIATAGRMRRSAAILWRQVRSPLVLILVVGAFVGLAAGDFTDAAMVMTILCASTALGFWREYRAESALAELKRRVQIKARVLRDGRVHEIAVGAVVPGDVVLLAAGSLVPADALLLESKGLFVDEAIISGESFPVAKEVRPAGLPPGAGIGERVNTLYFGTSVRSGVGRALVCRCGRETAYGALAQRLQSAPPETEFDRGLRGLGHLLLTIMFAMVLVVFTAQVGFGRASTQALMFTVALAVGLSPELLPAILAVNLARAATVLARHGVLVRHLSAIENLGSMDVLCTDKTGTLTAGVVALEGAYGPTGERDASTLRLALVNARFQGGLASPLDEAILRASDECVESTQRVGEVPYDFVRRRLSVVVRTGTRLELVTKGAFESVLAVCATAGGAALCDDARGALRSHVERWCTQGIRVLGVAARPVDPRPTFTAEDEAGLDFRGFLTFADPVKADVGGVIAELHDLGVRIKMITGDHHLVAAHVAKAVGLDPSNLMTGAELDETRDEALWQRVRSVEVFAEVDPNQKERILMALKRQGHVVGYMGDGINDVPAMHVADAGISVDGAADVARGAADFVLLEKDLAIIVRGVRAGRRTFANTLKYLQLTTSANLGNMLSMAAASLFLPFLPMLAGQVLLNAVLADVPAVGLAGDAVDPEMIAAPRRWDLRFMRRFMLTFGAVSSVFDLMMFGLLNLVFHAQVSEFRTAWFVESLLTQVGVVFVLRTRRAFPGSSPSTLLAGAAAATAALGVAMPWLPGVAKLDFVPLPWQLVATVALVTVFYLVVTEVVKRAFLRREARLHAPGTVVVTRLGATGRVPPMPK